MPATKAVASRMSAGLIPALVLIGLLALGVAAAVRFFVRPPGGRMTVTAPRPPDVAAAGAPSRHR